MNQTLKQYKIKDCSFTGHSLGGALAQLWRYNSKNRRLHMRRRILTVCYQKGTTGRKMAILRDLLRITGIDLIQSVKSCRMNEL
ncbi:lipase family protein [Listeria aquatica]|uniref:lipase family protein n=1 Tax=Listeria aquatica TaxID=1494960 RepID=UPI003D030323